MIAETDKIDKVYPFAGEYGPCCQHGIETLAINQSTVACFGKIKLFQPSEFYNQPGCKYVLPRFY